MGQSLTGDGCRYCQPQEQIDRLGEWLDEECQDNERLIVALVNMVKPHGGTQADVVAALDVLEDLDRLP